MFYNYSYIACRQSELDTEIWKFHLHILEVGENSVIGSSNSNNETYFWTIFTLTWSLIGIALSAAALALLILTALLFAEWRQSYKNQLLIQFILARFFYTSVRFFGDIQNVFKMCPASNRIVHLDILIMIYTEMVLVTWMFVFSRQIYISLVKVFVTDSSNIWKVSICAWLGPAVVSLILHVVVLFGQDINNKFIFFYIFLIKWPVLIANAALFIITLRSVIKNNMKSEKNIRIIIVMIMLIFVFCFQQMVVDIVKIVFVNFTDKVNVITNTLIVSNIVAMYQCAFSVFFWVLGNANTRKLWRFQGRDLRDSKLLRVVNI